MALACLGLGGTPVQSKGTVCNISTYLKSFICFIERDVPLMWLKRWPVGAQVGFRDDLVPETKDILGTNPTRAAVLVHHGQNLKDSVRPESLRVSPLLFADDAVLLASSIRDLRRSLRGEGSRLIYSPRGNATFAKQSCFEKLFHPQRNAENDPNCRNRVGTVWGAAVKIHRKQEGSGANDPNTRRKRRGRGFPPGPVRLHKLILDKKAVWR